jgi:hypothetical protein
VTALLSGRRRVPAAVLVLLVAAGVVLAVVLGGGQDRGAPATPAAPSTPSVPSGGPGAEPAGPSQPSEPAPEPQAVAGGDAPPPALPAVALDEDAAAGDGVTAAVRSVETIQGEGHGPGQVDGPAVRVTVELRNGTAGALSLDGVSIAVTTGADALPASPIDDPAVRPFTGELAAGESATAVYVFTVQGGGPVTVEVGHRAGAPLLVFTGTP